ncbi:HTH domain-containing protein [Paenibacillus sp. 2KB_22]|uniref:HTH domain-containing protein n=1 Tax=Paenibacillus sp. 2KB_22 TaxID=3232978 RepID=UPI003F96EE73
MLLIINSSNSDGEPFNKLLEKVMATYKLSTQTLSKMSNCSEDMILGLLNDTLDITKYSQSVISEFQQFIVLLSVGFESIGSNERVRGVVDHLIQNMNFSADTLALFSKLETQDVHHFLENPESLSFEKRYNLATTTLFLHYVCKP